MRARLPIAGAALALLASLLVLVQPASAAVGIRVSSGRIVEANGTPFIMRGVNHAHTWFPTQTSSFANIKALGANAVRVVLASGQRWPANSPSDVANVISLCKQNRLICVLEVHDTTGFGEQGGAASLSQAVDYWISIQSALRGQENYVIINIGNEPFGNGSVTSQWTQATIQAIQRLRSAGFEHAIMVDAPNWGQDWEGIMRSNAAQVFASDPLRNTIFDIHMYGVYDTAAEVTAYLDAYVSAGLPIVIGEFGHNHSDGNPDEDAIMAAAQARGIGYLGWSWSGNSGGVEYLDMTVNFNPNQLTQWGQRIFNGANGIRETAREATIYSGGGGGGGDTQPPTAPGTPTASGVTATSATLSWPASTDNVGVVGYNVYREQGASDPLLAQPSTNSVTLTGLTPNTQYQVYVRARDAAGNLSPSSPLATFTTSSGGGGGGSCRVAYSASNWGGSNGFTANVTITNTSGTPVNGWSLVWTYTAGQRVTQMWNATYTQPSTTVTATNVSYNSTIAPNGGSVSFGFNGTHSGSNPSPTAFTLNGTACTVQ